MLTEIKKSFSLIDENGDGRISSHELLRASRLLGMNPTLQDAEAMIKEVDEDSKSYFPYRKNTLVLQDSLKRTYRSEHVYICV